MTPGPAPADRNGIAAQMQRIVDGLGTLVREHVTLARMELLEDAKAVGGDVGKVAAFAPFLIVGYVFVCIALALLVGQALGAGWGFLIVGALNLLVGGVGVWLALGALKNRRVLEETVDELRASAALLSSAKNGEAVLPAATATTSEVSQHGG